MFTLSVYQKRALNEWLAMRNLDKNINYGRFTFIFTPHPFGTEIKVIDNSCGDTIDLSNIKKEQFSLERDFL